MNRLLKYGFFICACIFSMQVLAQDTAFAYTYGGTSYDYGESLVQTPDSGYLLVGNTGSFSNTNGNNDIYVIKIDSLGHYEWSKIYGTAQNDWANSVCKTFNGNYAICGYTNENFSNSYDILVMEINDSGNVKWVKTYGGTGWDLGYQIIATPDSCLAVAGETYSFGAGSDDGILMKLDSSGNKLWQKTYGGANEDYFKSLALTADSGFVLAGATNSFDSSQFTDVYLVRTDKNGDTLWTKTYGGDSTDYANSVAVDNINSTIILAGVSRSNGLDWYLLQTSDMGDIINTATVSFPNDDVCKKVIVTNAENYVFVGYVGGTVGNGGNDIYLLFENSTMTFLKAPTFGGSKEEEGNDVVQSSNGGFAVIGNTNTWGSGLSDFYFIKTKTDGFGVNFSSSFDDVDVTSSSILGIKSDNFQNKYTKAYPNPACNEVNLIYPKKEALTYDLTVYNMQGKVVETINSIKKEKIKLKTQQLKNGVYFFKITPQNSTKQPYSGKFIIEK